MGLMVSFPFLSKSTNGLLAPAVSSRVAEDQARLEQYRKAWQAYLAELPDPLATDTRANDNVKVNPIRAVIDVGVYFLFGSEVRFEVSPNRSTELGIDDHQENPDWLIELNKCWKANNKPGFLNELGISGAVHGDAVVKFIPNGAGINNDLPRLQLLDPANVRVEYDPDDYKKVTAWIIEYNIEDTDASGMLRHLTRTQEIRPVYEGQDESEDMQFEIKRISHWEIKNYEQEWAYQSGVGFYPGPKDKTRIQVGPTQTWDYPWAPIEHCNNLEIPHMFWGLPDVDESCVEVVQNIQRTMSSLSKIVRLHGTPLLFAKGVMPELAGEIDVSPENIVTLPAGAGLESDLKVLENLNNVQSFVEYIKELRHQLFEMMGCPLIALGQVDTMSMSMSGINLSILYAPILQKTEMKRISYGAMLERINQKLLILMGHEDTEEYDSLTVVWPEAMPGSAYLERQTLMEDVKLGLSQWTALTRLGYDPQLENQKMVDEKRQILEMESEFAMLQPSPLNPIPRNPLPQGGAPGGDAAGGKPGGQDPRGGNNNPSGFGNRNGSMGAAGNSTPKNKQNPSTPKSRGGPNRDARRPKK